MPVERGLFLPERTVGKVLVMAIYHLFPTSLGMCGVAWRDDTVIASSLPEETPEKTALKLARLTGAEPGDPPDAVEHAIDLVTALLDGEKVDLSTIACDFGEIDPLATKVLGATRDIPPGETSTYGTIAKRLGDIRLAQRVGQALGRNPIPIIVPCHRVLGQDGRLVGFSARGGMALKLKMLEIEGAQIGEPPGLFGDLPMAVKPGR